MEVASTPATTLTNPAAIFRRAGRNLGWLAGGKAVSGALSLVYLALAVRALGVEAFGQMILIYTCAQLVSAVVQFQTWQPILHFGTPALQAGRFGDFRRIVRFALALDAASAIVAAGLVAGGIWLIGPWIGLTPEILPLASGFAIAVPFMVFAAPDGLLRLFDRFDLALVEDNVEALVRLIGAALVFFLGGGLAELLLVWGLSVIASGTTGILLAWREVRRRGVWRGAQPPGPERRLAMQFPGIWRFVWATNFASTLELSRDHVATIVVGGVLDPTGAGLFRIARQIAEALAKPLKLMIPVVYPELARMAAEGNYALLHHFNRRAMLYAAVGAVGGFALLAGMGPLILELIAGDRADGALAVMLILSAAVLVRIFAFALEPTLISLGHPSLALGIQAVVAAAYLPLLLGMLHWIGLEGAGVAAVCAALLTVALQVAGLRARFPAVAYPGGSPS